MYNVCHHHLKLTTEENYYSNNNYNNKLLNCLQRGELLHILLNYLNNYYKTLIHTQQQDS